MTNKIVIAFLLLVSIAMFFYGLTQQIAAEREASHAAQVIEKAKDDLQICVESARNLQVEAEAHMKLASEALKKCQGK